MKSSNFLKLFTFWLFLLVGLAFASPAQDLFDEAVYHLSLQYGGPADVRPGELAPQFQTELDKACAELDPCPAEVARPVIEALVTAVGDRHTSYIPPASFEEVMAFLGGEGEALDFGILARGLPGRVGVIIVEIAPDSPAEYAGLQRGDLVQAIDGSYLFRAPSVRVATLLERAGDPEPARLTVLRNGTERFDVTLAAEPLSRKRLPTLHELDDDVALLRIPSFVPAGEVAARVHDLLRDVTARALVVDLRNSPGGYIMECLGAAGAFGLRPSRQLKGAIVSQVVRYEDGQLLNRVQGGREFAQVVAEPPARFTGPVAVLINEHTASCAEFFSLDLQDAGHVVVGEESAGVANSATGFIRLSDGSGIQITTSLALREDGGFYPAHVTPDIIVANDLEELAQGHDRVLEVALDELARR